MQRKTVFLDYLLALQNPIIPLDLYKVNVKDADVLEHNFHAKWTDKVNGLMKRQLTITFELLKHSY